MRTLLSCLFTALALAAGPSFAQSDIVKHPVQFAKGKSGTTIKDTVFIPWLQASLPPLKARMEAASRSATVETDRLYYADMAVQVGRLQKIGMP